MFSEHFPDLVNLLHNLCKCLLLKKFLTNSDQCAECLINFDLFCFFICLIVRPEIENFYFIEI